MTLLQKINSPSLITDERLMDELLRILRPAEYLPLMPKIKTISNGPDPIFRYVTSRITLQTLEEMSTYRKYIIHEFKKLALASVRFTLFYFYHIFLFV
jgi:hypothetical protein